jgi:hypothetical protein
LKDPDIENLDAGWDDVVPLRGLRDVASDAPRAPAPISAEPAGDLEPPSGAASEHPKGWDFAASDLDAGWDEAASSAPPPVGRESPPGDFAASRKEGGGVVRRERLSKRERRELEREQRRLGEKRRAERRAEEKRARKDAARRAAEQREAERREALERAARLERAERKKRSKARAASRSSKASRTRDDAADHTEPAETPRRRRFVMPNGGWIIVVIALITLGTAWYAFGR